MNNNIFRKKSVERMNSPENLGDCIKVTNPGVWLILAAVLILLVGVFVWGTFGRIEAREASGYDVRVTESDGVTTLYILGASGDVKDGAILVLDGTDVVLYDVEHVSDADSYDCIAKTKTAVPAGNYSGDTVYIRPISLIFD